MVRDAPLIKEALSAFSAFCSEGGSSIILIAHNNDSFDRPFLEAWVRPGLDPKNWTDRNNMTANGIIETSDSEWSLYISEHYRSADNRIRRLTVRKQGFASMHADAKGGEFITKPLRFTGGKLMLNYSTSAAGSIQIEVQDGAGKPLATMPELYGDELAASALDVSALKGQTIRLRVHMKDADLYALRFAD